MSEFGQNVLFTVASPVSTTVFPNPHISPLVRLWDSGTGLPVSGSVDYANLTRALPILVNKGFKVLLTLGHHKTTAITDDVYKQVLHTVSDFAGLIEAVEIWNEPNNGSDSGLTVDAVGHLAQLAHAELNGKVTLVGPASQGFGGLAYFQQFVLKYGSFVDVFSHHFYGWQSVMPDDFTFASSYAKKFKSICGDKPLWCTEYNLIGMPAASVKGQAAYNFIHEYTRGLIAGGVDRCYWYQWDGTNMPIVLTSNRSALTAEGQLWEQAVASLAKGQ